THTYPFSLPAALPISIRWGGKGRAGRGDHQRRAEQRAADRLPAGAGGHATLGRRVEEATAKWYLRAMNIGVTASNMPNRYNAYDLDPTYKNVFGQPLLRLTYNFLENDKKVIGYVAQKAAEIARSLKPASMTGPGMLGDYNIVPYQSTHNTGGAIMGSSPGNSALNKYLQSWDVPNVFVLGASAFPHNSAYNPTGPVGAL